MPKIFPLTPSLSYVHVSFFPPCCPFQYLILSSYSISFLSLCFLRVHCDAYLSLLCPISFISLNVLPIFLFPLCSSLSHTHIVMPTYLFYVLSLLFIWISVFPIFCFLFIHLSLSHCDAYLSFCHISSISLYVLPIFLFTSCSSLSHCDGYLYLLCPILYIALTLYTNVSLSCASFSLSSVLLLHCFFYLSKLVSSMSIIFLHLYL